MTRSASVAAMRRRSAATTRRDLPREGTLLRLVYDLLYEHRGRYVPHAEWRAAIELVGSNPKMSGVVAQLRDYYGCDVRPHWGGPMLAGEWVGRAYVDYVAERLGQP